jgi:microcystin-dependent protein
MPQHNHMLMCGGSADGFAPQGNLLGTESNQQTQVYVAGNPVGQMNSQAIGTAGGSEPFSLMQPYLGLNYIICMEGIFPSRN